MTILGSFTQWLTLASLPALVRKQRRLEQTIASIGTAIEDEKALRKDIDALLVKIGLESGEAVTCLGYDVIHRERAGQERLDAEKAKQLLYDAGVDAELVDEIFKQATDRDDTVKFAEVTPSKGAKVRATEGVHATR